MNSIIPDLTTPMITNIKLPNSIKAPLFFHGTLGCPRETHVQQTQDPITEKMLTFNPRTGHFESFCPFCEVKVSVSIQAIICLVEKQDHVINSNGHWFTENGDLRACVMAYRDLIAQLPYYEPEPVKKTSFLMTLVNWFK